MAESREDRACQGHGGEAMEEEEMAVVDWEVATGAEREAEAKVEAKEADWEEATGEVATGEATEEEGTVVVDLEGWQGRGARWRRRGRVALAAATEGVETVGAAREVEIGGGGGGGLLGWKRRWWWRRRRWRGRWTRRRR